jgi:hypothetical protein
MKLINTIITITFTSLLASNIAIATPHQKLAMLSMMNPSVLGEEKINNNLKSKKNSWNCLRSIDTVRRKARKVDSVIIKSSQRHSVDADLIRAVIAVESCYNVYAVSPAGAQGLMQLIPDTADRFGVSNSFDIKQNINAGTKYLSFLLRRYNGDLQKTAAAYNAGEGKVDRYNGIPPYRETRNYVKNVLRIFGELSGNYNPALFTMDDGLVNRHPASYEGMSAEERAILSRIRLLGVKSAYHSRKKTLVKRKYTPRISKAKAAHKRHTSVYKNGLKLGGYKKPMLNINHLSPRKQRAIMRLKALQKKLRLRNTRSSKTYAMTGKPGRQGWRSNRQRAPQLYKRR